MDDADGDFQIFHQFFPKKVADGGEPLGGFRGGGGPLGVESFEAGVVERARCLKNPQQRHWAGGGDGFVLGTGLGDRPLHVRLAAGEPHLADEQVGDFDRRQACLSHAQGAAIRAGLHGWELGEPTSVRVCRCGLSLAGEGNRHLLAGAGLAPDGDGFFPLQDSARLEEGGHRDFRKGWLTE